MGIISKIGNILKSLQPASRSDTGNGGYSGLTPKADSSSSTPRLENITPQAISPNSTQQDYSGQRNQISGQASVFEGYITQKKQDISTYLSEYTDNNIEEQKSTGTILNGLNMILDEINNHLTNNASDFNTNKTISSNTTKTDKLENAITKKSDNIQEQNEQQAQYTNNEEVNTENNQDVQKVEHLRVLADNDSNYDIANIKGLLSSADDILNEIDESDFVGEDLENYRNIKEKLEKTKTNLEKKIAQYETETKSSSIDDIPVVNGAFITDSTTVDTNKSTTNNTGETIPTTDRTAGNDDLNIINNTSKTEDATKTDSVSENYTVEEVNKDSILSQFFNTSDPSFKNGRIDIANQGKIGDCVLISIMNAVSSTKTGQEIISTMFDYQDDRTVLHAALGDVIRTDEDIVNAITRDNISMQGKDNDNDYEAVVAESGSEKLIDDLADKINNGEIYIPKSIDAGDGTQKITQIPNATTYEKSSLDMVDPALIGEILFGTPSEYYEFSKLNSEEEEKIWNMLVEDNSTNLAVTVDGLAIFDYTNSQGYKSKYDTGKHHELAGIEFGSDYVKLIDPNLTNEEIKVSKKLFFDMQPNIRIFDLSKAGNTEYVFNVKKEQDVWIGNGCYNKYDFVNPNGHTASTLYASSLSNLGLWYYYDEHNNATKAEFVRVKNTQPIEVIDKGWFTNNDTIPLGEAYFSGPNGYSLADADNLLNSELLNNCGDDDARGLQMNQETIMQMLNNNKFGIQ